MNDDELTRRYGNRFGLGGMVDTQTTIPFATPDDVSRPHDGRLTHVLEPAVPYEHIPTLGEELYSICIN